MNIKKLIVTFFIIISIISLSFFIHKKYLKKPTPQPFVIESPIKRTIHQEVHATGILEIKDHIEIGSLVSGTIKEIYVKENELVKKGQLLALIDNGKGDTDVKTAEGEVEYAQASLKYQEKYFKRQKALYKSGQISKNFFEQVTRDYELAKANLKSRKAILEKAQIDYGNIRILSPRDGIIVSIGITEGIRITTDLDATVLFVIAKDITKMEAILDIDESDIGEVKKGQKVNFTVSTYLNKEFKGIVSDVSYTPQSKNNILSFKATVAVEDPDNLLRPGMTINAKIKIAKCKESYSISALAFQINQTLIKALAKKLNFKFKQLSKKEKKEIENKNNTPYSIKYVWTLKNKEFAEIPIKVHITNDRYFQIKEGANANNKIIVDIESSDDMENFYKNIFKSAI